MTRCARCDWQPDRDADGTEREQQHAHALEAEHPLCSICARSLTKREGNTCERCISAAQTDLATVLHLYAWLPGSLGRPAGSSAYDQQRVSGTDEQPLLGGDALVLLAPGGMGVSVDAETTDDTPSADWTLCTWEDDWRNTRREPAAMDSGSRRQVVRAAAHYLERHTRWAANNHPAFAEYRTDLRLLVGALERATGRDTPTWRADVECSQCGARELQRDLTDAGFADRWSCRRCKQGYTWAEYLMACRAKVEDGRAVLSTAGWGTPKQVSAAVGIGVETVRKWAQRATTSSGGVTAACLVKTGELVVWYPEAEARATRRHRSVA